MNPQMPRWTPQPGSSMIEPQIILCRVPHLTGQIWRRLCSSIRRLTTDHNNLDGGNHVRQKLGKGGRERGAAHGDHLAGPEIAGDARARCEVYEGAVVAGAVLPGGVRIRQGVHAHRCGRQRLHRLLLRHLRHRAGPLPSQSHRGGAAGGRRADERPRLHHADQDAAAGEAGRDHARRRRQETRRACSSTIRARPRSRPGCA